MNVVGGHAVDHAKAPVVPVAGIVFAFAVPVVSSLLWHVALVVGVSVASSVASSLLP